MEKFIIWLLPLPPLLSFFVILLFTNKRKALSHGIAIGAAGLSWLGSMIIFIRALGVKEFGKHIFGSSINWLPTGSTWLKIGVQIDPLSAAVVFFVAWTVLAIFVYSIGYHNFGQPKGDHDVAGLPPHGATVTEHGHKHTVPSIEPMYSRFFAFISLFAFGMYTLVVSDNLLTLFVGWEIMGLCSYLLIGFWFGKPSARDAAVKAFMTTRIGDVFMLLGIAFVYSFTGSLSFSEIFKPEMLQALASTPAFFGLSAAGIIGLLLFIGTVGKSAQWPLHVWLPDAMEGPTPVSAMIHAATMVSAGVYMVIRMFPLISAGWTEGMPLNTTMSLIAFIGAFTALFAATIAVAQNDIKRVLAYSTISQLGFMIAALGIGAYVPAAFHLVTHAFFKALLFLAAGVVIHALGGEQDMRKMGGLRKRMPRTFIAMLIGTGALAGLPLLSGFFSKDAILAAAVSGGIFDKLLFAAGIAGVLLTALYSFRLLFLVFSGEESELVRKSLAKHKGPEGPRWMTVPVGLLALLAVAGGWMQIAGLWHPFSTFLEVTAPTFAYEPSALREWLLSAVSVGITLGGIWIAWAIYSARTQQVPRAPKALVEKLYFDRAYDRVFYRPAVWLAQRLGSWFERPVIERSGEEIGLGALGGGRISAAIQNGLARTYVLLVAAGASLIVLLFLVLR